jgi:LacI family transcriptional regulator
MMAEQLLRLDDPPTAIFAGCDTSALGVLAAARDRHLRIPEDLSVVGFDDTYLAESAAPPMTTVRQPLREMGRLAVRTVLGLARGERPDTHHFELATTLIVRESTAPPRSSPGQ